MKISKSKLNSGLEYLNVYEKDLGSVTILVLINVGSRNEEVRDSGLAHFVEHTFFKGSKLFPSSKDIGMAIEKLGGSSNAFTSYDYTGYYIKVPVENFDNAVKIMADMIKNPLFPQKEVEKERGVVIEEIRMYEDIPMRKVEQHFMTELFGDHPLGRDIAGNIKAVNSFTHEDTLRFTENNYNTSNMLLVVSGGVDEETSKNIIEDSFSNIKKGEKSSIELFIPKNAPAKSKSVVKKVEQTHIVLGGLGLSRSIPERFAIGLGTTLLSRGFGSTLFQTIREQLGLAYYISSSHYGFNEVGYWSVDMGVDNNRVAEAVRAVIKELRDFRKGDFTEDNLERARNFMLGNLVTELESSDDIGYYVGSQLLLNKEIKPVEEVKNIILNLKKDEVIEIWEKIFSLGNYNITVLGPKEIDVDAKELQSIMD